MSKKEIKNLISENFDVSDKGKKPFDFYPDKSASCSNAKCDTSWCIIDKTNDDNVKYMKERFVRDIKNIFNTYIDSEKGENM